MCDAIGLSHDDVMADAVRDRVVVAEQLLEQFMQAFDDSGHVPTLIGWVVHEPLGCREQAADLAIKHDAFDPHLGVGAIQRFVEFDLDRSSDRAVQVNKALHVSLQVLGFEFIHNTINLPQCQFINTVRHRRNAQ